MFVHKRMHEQDDLFLHANSFYTLKKMSDGTLLIIENSIIKISSHGTRKEFFKNFEIR
jgi:hypothetical protein